MIGLLDKGSAQLVHGILPFFGNGPYNASYATLMQILASS